MQSFHIRENQAGQRFDKFLRKFMPAAGSGFLYKMLRKKNIVLNGKKAEGKEILAVGDTVSFFFSDETFRLFTGEGKKASACVPDRTEWYREAYTALKGITIIYEDKNIVIADKPAGMLTQRDGSEQYSLNEWFLGYLLAGGGLSQETLKTFHPSVQNRLDRNTSGIVLCGASLSGSQMLSELIRKREIEKYYITIVKGNLKEAGILSGWLSKDARTNKVRIGEDGRAVRTEYRPLAFGDDCTCLAVKLITGRPHQIRAHMASIGHPIMGDVKYGDADFNEFCRKKYGVRYQLLHAARIAFPTRIQGFAGLEGSVFTAPLPTAFKEVCSHGNMELTRIERFCAGRIDKSDQ